ncbi:MAG: PASTA domain-containing protein [Deltaproteobacteria bacterium]|nr:PASTA domain-containing protein [Deltaproteobacteria bacterium]
MNGTSAKWLKFRILTLIVFFMVLYVALVSRAFHLQVYSQETLKTLADKQHIQTLSVPSERGMIFDRNGEKLAISVMADSVYADPTKIRRPSDIAKKLKRILDIDQGALIKKLSTDRCFCWVARRISPAQAKKIRNLKIDGIFLVPEPKRFYPNGDLAGRLLGFVGMDSVGLEGLELKYDDYLRGEPEKLVWARDAKGKKLCPRVDYSLVGNQENYNLVLTIDSRIQHVVESNLLEAIREKGAKGGFAIVMDPKTGEILALADQPGFDPNNFASYTAGKIRNKAITDCFEPGSAFKPFLAAAALEEGVATETSHFDCEKGSYQVDDKIIRDANRKEYGVLTFHDILKYSSNIGSVKIYEALGKEKFYHYIRQFGFGEKTGIDFPGESLGLLRSQDKWTRVDGSTIAFGQGISVTAVQLITALSAIANQGILMKPYIVKGFVDKQGGVAGLVKPTPVRRVVSAETAKRLAAILTDVVGEEDGTGKMARIDNISVAGKTGTSQKFDFNLGIYSSKKLMTSFLGFFPAEDPQIAMLVTLDEPEKDRWGGVAAAPVFKSIAEQILTCFKTNIQNNYRMPVEEKKTTPPMKIQLVSVNPFVADNVMEANSIESTVMPDFRGLSIRETLKKSKALEIDIKIEGSGWAVSQNPSPGVILKDYKMCTVFFETGR